MMDTHLLPIVKAGDIVEIAAHDHTSGKDVFSRPAGQYVVDYVFRNGNLCGHGVNATNPHTIDNTRFVSYTPGMYGG